MRVCRTLVFLLIAALWGCAPEEPVEPVFEPEPVEVPVRFEAVEADEVLPVLKRDLEAQDLDSWEELEPALERSLEYIRTRDEQEKAVCEPELCVTWKEMKNSLELFNFLLSDIDRNPEVLKHYFDFYRVNPNVLLTGYYEPLLQASKEPGSNYPYPVYGHPDDLHAVDLGEFHPRWEGERLRYRQDGDKIRPYYERREIDKKDALAGRDLEIAWVQDPVELFFLHIQGSGRLEYPDGKREHVLYAGQNGRQYVSLGRVLEEKGYLESDEITMQSIREVLEKNSDKKYELMASNPSYIFFELADQGPKGATGHILTPWVSVASDPELIPWGSLLILDAELPEYQGEQTRIQGPVLAQDTGGAIQGRHLDLFCGFGERPEYLAGKMQDRANVYFMVRKDDQD